MENAFEPTLNVANLENDPLTATTDTPTPLPLSRRAEVWGGRLAMVGFVTTVVAIAVRASI